MTFGPDPFRLGSKLFESAGRPAREITRKMRVPHQIRALPSRVSACSEFFLCGTFTFPSFERERLRAVSAEQ